MGTSNIHLLTISPGLLYGSFDPYASLYVIRAE